MNTRNIGTLLIVSLTSVVLASPAFASSARVEIRQEINASRKEMREDIKEAWVEVNGVRKDFREELKNDKKDLRIEIKENIASKVADIKNFFTGFAVLKQAKVTAKTDTTLTVELDGKSYTVNLTGATKLRRRFFGKSDIDEILVGHMLNVYGKWSDENHTVINAILVRDISIQLRLGVFVGVIKSIAASTWSLETKNRGTQQVTVSSDTKFVNRKNETIGQADIQTEHRVRVKGLWDRVNNTITGVSQVKDYTLPPVPVTKVPTVTP